MRDDKEGLTELKDCLNGILRLAKRLKISTNEV